MAWLPLRNWSLLLSVVAVVACAADKDSLSAEEETQARIDEQCEGPDPSVTGQFEVDVTDFVPEQDPYAPRVNLELDCTVVALAGDDVLLECPKDDGGFGSITVTVPGREEFWTVWVVGDRVSLAYVHEVRNSFIGPERRLTIREAGGALMVFARDSELLDDTDAFPMRLTADEYGCEGSVGDFGEPFVVEIADGQARSLVAHGHRGELETDEGRFVIDLGQADSGLCCHQQSWFRLVVQRADYSS